MVAQKPHQPAPEQDTIIVWVLTIWQTQRDTSSAPGILPMDVDPPAADQLLKSFTDINNDSEDPSWKENDS